MNYVSPINPRLTEQISGLSFDPLLKIRIADMPTTASPPPVAAEKTVNAPSFSSRLIEALAAKSEAWATDVRNNRRLFYGLLLVIALTLPLGLAWSSAYRQMNSKSYLLYSGLPKGGYAEVARALVRSLGKSSSGYETLEERPSAGADENAAHLAADHFGEFAFVQGGMERLDGLFSVASLYNSYLYVFARKERHYQGMGDVMRAVKAGTARIYAGKEGSGAFQVMLAVASQFGVDLSKGGPSVDRSSTFAEAQARMKVPDSDESRLDVCCLLVKPTADTLGGFPASRFALVAIPEAPAIELKHSQIRASFLPNSAVSAGIPSNTRMPTVYVKEYLLCNKYVRDCDAYYVLQALDMAAVDLPNLHSFDRAQPEREFEYPLHPGAREFYLRHQLPVLANIIPAATWVGLATNVTLLLGFFLLLVRRRRIRPLLDDARAAYNRGLLAHSADDVENCISSLASVEERATKLYAEVLINDDERRRCVEFSRFRKDQLRHKLDRMGPILSPGAAPAVP